MPRRKQFIETKQALAEGENHSEPQEVPMSDQVIEPIVDDAAFGEFAISDHTERVYKQVYYSIRELQGYLAKRSMGEDFDWTSFKAKFTEVFGTSEERKYSKEQLLAYAMQKFGKTEADLIEANARSWERRREWQLRQLAALAEDQIRF